MCRLMYLCDQGSVGNLWVSPAPHGFGKPRGRVAFWGRCRLSCVSHHDPQGPLNLDTDCGLPGDLQTELCVMTGCGLILQAMTWED